MHPLKYEKNISREYLYVAVLKYCSIECCFTETHKNIFKYLIASFFFLSKMISLRKEGFRDYKSETN